MVAQIFPVIHHLDAKTSISEADLSFKCGADGVFLISHHGQDSDLFEPYKIIKSRYPHKKVGINFLSKTAIDAAEIAISDKLDMVWTDNPGVHSSGISDDAITLAHMISDHPIMFFGSVAFKYQKSDNKPEMAALIAESLGMIPTTSGKGTGYAPELAKIKSMYNILKQTKHLAIASGMTPENIKDFAPYLSHILVSTGISKGEYHIDEGKLKLFINNSKN